MRYNPGALIFRRATLALGLLVGMAAAGARLSPLAPAPDWPSLDRYQETITREDFRYLLETVYAPGGAAADFVKIGPTSATIATAAGQPPFVLRFAPSAGYAKPVPRFWRGRAQLPPRPDNRPLHGLRIAIDPGHLGGVWAKMEERWFQIGDAAPVTEGDMTLYVAKLLVPRLEALGAEVFLTRHRPGPVTPLRPKRLTREAAAALEDREVPVSPDALRTETERLFYRVGEIHRRAELVNERIRPDLVICLHFNAEAWGDPARPTLTDKNHLHFLITGAFSAAELRYDDQRFNMISKLLSRTYREELLVSEAVATAMARATKLPPYEYLGANAIKVGTSPFVWARNLLANRLFQCPVVYVEPYVMNSAEVHARVQAGDYEGTRVVAGKDRPSIYREYADSLVQGLVEYYAPNRAGGTP